MVVQGNMFVVIPANQTNLTLTRWRVGIGVLFLLQVGPALFEYAYSEFLLSMKSLTNSSSISTC